MFGAGKVFEGHFQSSEMKRVELIDNNNDSSTSLRVLTFWRKMLSLTNNRPIFK